MSEPDRLELSPAILTIFGITGDLAHRKLLPALYHLAHDQLLPKTFRIVGVTRRGTTVDDLINSIRASVEASGQSCDQTTLNWLAESISIATMDITNPDDYANLKKLLDKIEDEIGACLTRLFYLSIPSSVFGPVIRRLGEKELSSGCQHGSTESRLLIEKPFGYDLASAEELIEILNQSFDESQIYRIDHYLAKETVQNILVFRSQNPLFRQIWNNRHISSIEISATEQIGIEGRVAFYEQMGALRDIIQSHLLQLLALAAMELPTTNDAVAIHQAKSQLLKSVKPPSEDKLATNSIRGQYQNYRQEVSNPHTEVETFAAVKLHIDSPNWQNVPVIIKTGKSLNAKSTEIKVSFAGADDDQQSNCLIIRLQPNEGISLVMRIKKPGYADDTETIQMDFNYGDRQADHPDAYERVLVDSLRGDKTLFATSEEVLQSWRIVEPILHAWQQGLVPLIMYEPGSEGPQFKQ